MELTINLPSGDQRLGMIGAAERNLKLLREALGVTLCARDSTLKLSGDSAGVGKAAVILEHLAQAAHKRQPLSRAQLLALIADTDRHDPRRHATATGHRSATDPTLDVYARGRRLIPATPRQGAYVRAVFEHDLTFCVGPAGTGKTYLAVAAAVTLLKRGVVRKLVLCRPAVEAGERLGFLPGDLQQKVNPYLRPLIDALHDMMDFEQLQRFMAVDVIEIIPLAFMRGRTLNDALIILDEAQNTTRQQMLMFLTRLGQGGKMIVTGDTTQVDLPDPRQSGLVDAVRRLKRIKDAAFVTLDRQDIVRHRLVQDIVEAYGSPASRKGAPPTS